MAHIALYRTWRPQAFRDIVGQQHITRTLQNSLREGRLSHAYLFNGPRGTGKTTAAKILAKAVNCEQGMVEEPCNTCSACRRITDGAVMDVLEIDAASNRGVDEIRDIREKVKYAPTEVRHKVYIIDEVHMLTTEAFNALLKTLEEPPSHVMFVLATTEPHRLPATILSRCQRFDFRRIPLEEQVGRLRDVCEAEQVTAEEEALSYLARLSDGGMRDAIGLLDQMIAFTGKQLTLQDVLAVTGGIGMEQFAQLAQAIAARDVGAALGCIGTMMEEGRSADKCMEHLLHYFRDALMLQLVPGAQAHTDRVIDPAAFQKTLASFTTAQLFQMIDVLNRYQSEMKFAVQPQTIFEVAVMKLCVTTGAPDHADVAASAPALASNGSSADVDALQRRIEQLETKLNQLAEQGESGRAARAPEQQRLVSPRANAKPTAWKQSVNLDPYLPHAGSDVLKAVLGQWGTIMQTVKERKIMIHAWLVDGEPVAATEDSILLAFKSAMHRETTEKETHRQLIEQVMQEQLGKPYQLATVMMKEWKEALSDVKEKPEDMRMDVQEEKQDDVVDEAIRLFGEDLVVVKE